MGKFGCLVHVLKNICFVVWKHVWKYMCVKKCVDICVMLFKNMCVFFFKWCIKHPLSVTKYFITFYHNYDVTKCERQRKNNGSRHNWGKPWLGPQESVWDFIRRSDLKFFLTEYSEYVIEYSMAYSYNK